MTLQPRSAINRVDPSDALLDHLIGGRQERFRYRETERLGSLEVDDQINFCDLLHREIARFLAA